MKNQALFSSRDKSKKLKSRLLQFLFGTLRVNNAVMHPKDADGITDIVDSDHTAPLDPVH